MQLEKEAWTSVIRPTNGWFNVNLKELNYINVNFKINPLDELENLGKKLKNQSIHYDLLISKLDELTKEKKLND